MPSLWSIAFYKWKARYATQGEAGLCDRPRAPRRSPSPTPREVFFDFTGPVHHGRDGDPPIEFFSGKIL